MYSKHRIEVCDACKYIVNSNEYPPTKFPTFEMFKDFNIIIHRFKSLLASQKILTPIREKTDIRIYGNLFQCKSLYQQFEDPIQYRREGRRGKGGKEKGKKSTLSSSQVRMPQVGSRIALKIGHFTTLRKEI